MPTVTAIVDIAAPPESVGAVLLDIDAAPIWTAGLERLEFIEGVVGQAGCVGLAHYVEGGRSYTLEDRLLEVTPDRHYKSEITGGGLKATVETTLEEVSGGTRMTVCWSGTGTNPLTRLMLPLLKKRIAKRSEADLHALRRLVEDKGAET